MAAKSEGGASTPLPVGGQCGLGEGPHWDEATQKLYFVDIFNQKICRLDPATGTVTSAYVENGPIGFVIPVEGMPGKLVAGIGTDFALVNWDGESNITNPPIKKLATVDTDRSETRFNDGKVDSSGRVWAGTMGAEKNGEFVPNQGTLYSITGKNQPKREVSPVTISNGLAWSLNDDTFYYIDSLTYRIMAFDYNPKTGAISNRRDIFDLKKNNIPGIPDGMTIDTDGNLWVAIYLGGRVIQVNPKNGELLRTLPIPAKRVTSVAFGGPGYETLYVTTACHGMNEAQLKEEQQAGYLFVVKDLGVRGLPANSFKLNA